MPLGLTMNVLGRDVSASSTLRHVEGEAHGSAHRIGESFREMGRGVAAGFLGAGVAEFLKTSFERAEAAEKVGRQTEAVLKSTGEAAHVSAEEVSGMADSIARKTGIDKLQVQAGENMLLTFKGVRNEVGAGNDIFNQATVAATDMATAMGISQTQAALQLGKALNDPEKGLSRLQRVGVTFTDQQKTQIRTLQRAGNVMGAQKVILHELTSEFGGSAEAQATAGGKLRVAFDDAAQSVGDALLPVVTDLANFLTADVVPAFSATVGFLQANGYWLKYVAGAALAMWGAYKGYTIARDAVRGISTALEKVGPAMTSLGTRARSAGSTIGGMSTGAMASIAGIGLVIGAGLYAWQRHKAAAAEALAQEQQNVSELTDALKEDNGAVAEHSRAWARNELQMAGSYDLADKIGVSYKTMTDAALGNRAALNQLNDAMGKNMSQGEISDALINGQIMTVLGMNHTLDKAKHGYQQLSTAQKEDQKSQQKSTVETKKGTTAMDRQKSAADALLASIKKLSGDKIGAAQAELRFRDGVAQATQQVKDNGRSLSANTVKGRANREWLLDQLSALQDVASAQLTAGQKTDVVTNTLGRNERALRKAALGAHLNRQEVNQLIARYGRMPTVKSTRVGAPGAATAGAQTGRLNSNLRGMPRSVAVHVNAYGADIASRGVQQLRRDLANLPANVTVGVNAQGLDTVSGSGHYAQGTGFNQRAGVYTTSEYGSEDIYLPRGARVVPHSTAMSQRGDGGQPVQIVVQVQGALATKTEIEKAVVGALESHVGHGGRLRIGRGVQ